MEKMLIGTDMFVALPCTTRSQTNLCLTILTLFIPCNMVRWKTHVTATNACYLFHTAPTCFGAIISPSSGIWNQNSFQTYSNKVGLCRHMLTETHVIVWRLLPEDGELITPKHVGATWKTVHINDRIVYLLLLHEFLV